MLHHNIQRKIIRSLAIHDSVSFTQLRPDHVESNAFAYHLKFLIKEGFVRKREDGDYELTALGKMLGINSHLSTADWLKQAHAVFFITVFDPERGWLVRRRKTQPMYGYVGFVHGEPNHTEPVTSTATSRFEEYNGLHAKLEPRGYGYARFTSGDELQSFTTFTVFSAVEWSGKLREDTPTGHNYWATLEQLKGEPKLLPTMLPILEKLEEGDPFWLDLSFEV